MIVPFSHAVAPNTAYSYSPVVEGSKERELLNAYPSPNTSTFALTQSTITEKKLTKNNYRARMHELLAVEEMARYQQVRDGRLDQMLVKNVSLERLENNMALDFATAKRNDAH